MTPDVFAAAAWQGRAYVIGCAYPAPEGLRVQWAAVDGYVCEPFASRRRHDGRWSLDHMPTGASLGSFDRLRDAKDLARRLVEHTGGTEAWQFTDANAIPDEARAAINELCSTLVGIG